VRHNRGVLTLRRMGAADLRMVKAWLRDPDVARWYLAATTIENELDDLRLCIGGEEQTEALIAAGPRGPIGWCQWYLCDYYPDHAAGVGAAPGDAGIDYAIGDPASRGRGVGTELIATLVTYVRQRHPHAGVIADPEASNLASRRVLEKNGFLLLAERPVASEPTPAPMAIYRLPPRSGVPDRSGASAPVSAHHHPRPPRLW
jgi:aminoglycoside 6'-N-acetyltransferase